MRQIIQQIILLLLLTNFTNYWLLTKAPETKTSDKRKMKRYLEGINLVYSVESWRH